MPGETIQPSLHARTEGPILAGILLIAILIAAFNHRALADDGPAPVAKDDTTQPSRLDDLRAFADMVQLIRDHYVEELPEHDLMNLAMAGLVAGLDDNSHWLPPHDFQVHNDGSRGRQGGIGAEFETRDQRLYVVELSPGGPAENAGILEGDQLLQVDNRPVRGRALYRSLEALDGEVGTGVELRVRTEDQAPRTLRLERAWIPVDSVEGRWVTPGTAYLAISHFNDHSALDFERELERLTAGGDSSIPSAIIIDLRDNRGGVLPSALAIADGFLDEGLVVETRGRTPSTRMNYIAQPGQWYEDADVAVLVGPLTASASEILAGALQDHGRAKVYGMNSFGKGTVQSVVPLRDGSALKFTTAKYYTPSGREIEGSGIKPDRQVEGGIHPVGEADDPVVAAALADFPGGPD